MIVIRTDRDLYVMFQSIVDAHDSDQLTGCDVHVRHVVAKSSYESQNRHTVVPVLVDFGKTSELLTKILAAEMKMMTIESAVFGLCSPR